MGKRKAVIFFLIHPLDMKWLWWNGGLMDHNPDHCIEY